MAKKKIKLNSEQKRHLKRLKDLQEAGVYIGDQDLKDVVTDGGYAVLSIRAPVFESAVCTHDEETARIIMKYNPASFTRIINLNTGETIVDRDCPWIPRMSCEEI